MHEKLLGIHVQILRGEKKKVIFFLVRSCVCFVDLAFIRVIVNEK